MQDKYGPVWGTESCDNEDEKKEEDEEKEE